jgi:WD40 repeat protein
MAVSSSSDGTLKVYDLKKCLVLKTFNCFFKLKEFGAIDINDYSFFIASACQLTFVICIWSLKTGELIEILRGHDNVIIDFFFLKNKIKIISGSLDKTFRIWKFKNYSNLDGFCECQIFKTHDKILKMRLNSNFTEIAFLVSNDCVFFMEIKNSNFFYKMQKGIRHLFKFNKKKNIKSTIRFFFVILF